MKLKDLIISTYTSVVTSTERPFVIGLSGPQGSGKSTLCAALKKELGDRTVILGLDDFYLTKTERKELAASVSPLLTTRGPPGTHAVELVLETVAALPSASLEKPVHIPLFDKRSDDRRPQADWQIVTAPPQLIIIEGWCIGATLAPDFAKDEPMNAIERTDADGSWRSFQASKLEGSYSNLWDEIDQFIHVQAPDFETVFDWRCEQETTTLGLQPEQLPEDRKKWLAQFIQHYERITKDMARGYRRNGILVSINADRKVIYTDGIN